MKTTVMAKSETVERKWYIVDATNIPLGRVASQVATVLKGKNKPTYTPHVDTGDFVIVINTDKMILTGKKLEQNYHWTHSQYMGGLKLTQYKTMMANKSDDVLYIAIKGMLPKNALGRKMLKKVRIYKNGEHKHEAQQPEVLNLQVKRYN